MFQFFRRAYWFFTTGKTYKPLKILDSDKLMLVSKDYLLDEGFQLYEAYVNEKINKQKDADLSIDLEYELEYEDGDSIFNIMHQITKYKYTFQSIIPMWIMHNMTRIFFRFRGIKTRKLPYHMSIGKSNQCYSIIAHNQHIGNLLKFRYDKYLYYLVIVGVYFDQEAWAEFISTNLENFQQAVKAKKNP